jgi:hypothetical protein
MTRLAGSADDYCGAKGRRFEWLNVEKPIAAILAWLTIAPFEQECLAMSIGIPIDTASPSYPTLAAVHLVLKR